MKLVFKYALINILALFLFQSCGDNPKVIAAKGDDSSLEKKTGIFADEGTDVAIKQEGNSADKDVHTVVVEEILPTSKYVYLFVKEGERKFWLAAAKQEVEIGATYFYKGGLLKKNFESKEHNRIFDELYLVSRVIPVDHGGSDAVAANTAQKKEGSTEPRSINVSGSVKIADLVANPEKYEGQIIQISGECVKVNPNIMERNWMHLKDGSKDDYDLVITSEMAVPQGHVVTMKGKVVLNKDFGAGYRYDILLEDGELVR